MDKEVLSYAVEKTNELMSAPSCSAETKKQPRHGWILLGQRQRPQKQKKYIDELEEDVTSLDNLIGFAESDGGIQAFGGRTLLKILQHMQRKSVCRSRIL